MVKSDWNMDGIVKAYFGECSKVPFADRMEEWQYWQRFLDMLCVTALFLKEQGCEESFQRVGGMLNDEELMKALEPHEKTIFQGKERFFQVFELLLAKEKDGPFAAFLTGGTMSYGEILAFLMAAAVDLNRKYERVFGVLQEEQAATAKPTLGLVLDLCALFLEEGSYESQLWNEDSFFYRFLLESKTEASNMSRLSRPLSLNRRVVQILAGEPVQIGGLSRFVRVMEYQPEMEELLSNQESFEELLRVFSTMSGTKEGGVIHLCAMEGVGKKFLMESLGSVAEMDVLCVDMPGLLAQKEEMGAVLKDLVLKCVYEKSLIYLEETPFEAGELPKVQRIVTFLQDYVKLFFIGSRWQKPKNLSVQGSWYTICSFQVRQSRNDFGSILQSDMRFG